MYNAVEFNTIDKQECMHDNHQCSYHIIPRKGYTAATLVHKNEDNLKGNFLHKY